jgi:hypothetical protein
VGQLKNGAIEEANFDPRVICGVDDVTLTNGITDCNLNGNTARTLDADATDYRLNIADHCEELACRLILALALYAARN